MYRYYGSWYRGDASINLPRKVFGFQPLPRSLALHSRIILSKVCNIVYIILLFMHIHTCNNMVILSYIYIQLLFGFVYLHGISFLEYTQLLCWFPFEYMLLCFR